MAQLVDLDADGRITWARLCMGPVDRDGGAIEDAVRQLAKPSG